MSTTLASHEALMRRAVALSRRGYPAPNPHVGCVIYRDGQIVGEGFHDHAGGPHAEVVALRKAGERARGADVYVTLEPCGHFGRTPPCVDALLEAGVASVTVACRDPNPQARGGLERLASAGVRVVTGLCEAPARAANEAFLRAHELGRPFVVGKTAMSLDGRVALPSGESKWITSPAARRVGRRLRADLGAVVVGRGTVARDNPLLTARVPGVVNQPVRVVLDPREGLSGQEHVFNAEAPTLHVVGRVHRPGQLQAPLMASGEIDLDALLRELFDRGLTGLLVEGGPTTLSRLLRVGLVDRLEVFLAVKLLGAGPAWFEGEVSSLERAIGFEISRVRRVGPDLWLTARPR